MDDQDFKAAMGRLGSGVCIITAATANGQPVGFTATSLTSLSLNPPLVLFCLGKSANSLSVFEAADSFGVCVLAHEQQGLSNLFAGKAEDKFADTDTWLTDKGYPLIQDCLAALECEKREVFQGGDHLIFVGEVKRVHLGEGAPLIYYQGKYHTL